MPKPLFDSSCFGTNSPLFIPTFRGHRKPSSNNHGATQPDEREARERLEARKEHMRMLADADDVVRYDKYHAANLIKDSERQRSANRPPPTSTPHPSDSSTTLPTCLSPTPPSEQAQIGRVTPCAPTPTPTISGLDDDQTDGQTNEEGRRGGHKEVVDEENETEEFEGVMGEIEGAQGRSPPPPNALVRHQKRDVELGEHSVTYNHAFTVKRRVNDASPGEYAPPRPPPDPPDR